MIAPEDAAEAEAFVQRLAAKGLDVVLIVGGESTVEAFHAADDVPGLCEAVAGQYWRGAGETIN